MADRSLRHQSSLEDIIDFSEADPIFDNDQQRTRVVRKFHRIVASFEKTEQQPASSQYRNGYNRPALIRLTFEYARSPKSQDKILQAFFQSLALDMFDDNDGEDAEIRELIFRFANHLIHHFFLPLRTAANNTPQPTPIYHNAVQQVQTQEEQQRMQDFVGTQERLGALRGTCLVRDRHRCVITRAFDSDEGTKRSKTPPAKDDDGNPLGVRDNYTHLEVAHIIPFSMTKADNGRELSESKKAAIAILNMFDVGAIHLIEGANIDRPRNALTLSPDMHRHFEKFEIFFERVSDDAGTPHTYRIRSLDPFLTAILGLPIHRTFFLHPSIDPPSERLLELHSAISHILRLSAAGAYINDILRTMEDGVVREDGSTQLGALVNAALAIRG